MQPLILDLYSFRYCGCSLSITAMLYTQMFLQLAVFQCMPIQFKGHCFLDKQSMDMVLVLLNSKYSVFPLSCATNRAAWAPTCVVDSVQVSYSQVGAPIVMSTMGMVSEMSAMSSIISPDFEGRSPLTCSMPSLSFMVLGGSWMSLLHTYLHRCSTAVQ